MNDEIAIITSSNEKYFDLLLGLLSSIKKCGLLSKYSIHVLDTGLTEWQGDLLKNQNISILDPGWDFPELSSQESFYKAMCARPFLPEHFSDADYLVWLDADTWIQDDNAIMMLMTGARLYGFAAIKELDRSYQLSCAQANFADIQRESYRKSLGERVANEMASNPTINVGVMAGHRDAPHWRIWQETMKKSVGNGFHFFTEQTVFNYIVYKNKLPVSYLPSTYNWLCNRCRPYYSEESQKFVEPNLPFDPIQIMHLAANTKYDKWEIITLEGEKKALNLRYPISDVFQTV